MTDKVDQSLIDPPKAADKKPVDLTDAYQRSEFLMIPRMFFPVFAAFFVLLCGGMAVMLFAVGKIFGGLLFSFVVLVGLYVVYNKLTHKDSI
jgi:hypothetical protein